MNRSDFTAHPLPEGVDAHSVFRSLFGAYPDAMLLVDRAGAIVLANPAATALLGYAADEFPGMNVDQLVPESIRPRHAAYRGSYVHNPKPRPMGTQMDLVAMRKDGSEVMVEIALSPLDEHGVPLVVASIRDIGAYPRVQKALQRARYSEHLAQLGRLAVDERDPQVLVEHAPRLAAAALQLQVALVSLLETDGRGFRIASGVGLPPNQQVGTRIANVADALPGYMLEHPQPLIMPDYRNERRVELPADLIESGLTCGIVVPISDRGRTLGTLTVHSHRPQAFGDDEVHFLESLSTLLATSLQRAQAEEALNHSQRLESVGQLTGGIAHDFNNLLTVIQGNLQFLEETAAIATNEHAQRLVGAATHATRRAAELTGKLLAFSRRQVLQPEAIEIGPMLRSLADMLRRTLDQRVHIHIEVEPDCPSVLADPVQLESALLNVAINARDAMPDGGALTFRAAAVDRLPDDPGVSDAFPQAEATRGAFVAIAIADTGSGMPDEVRERAFEPFFTTKSVGRGTGLGLSTVYGFVKQSHGAVTIVSAPGAGTTVTLVIPQLGAAPGVIDDVPVADVVPPGLRILLVEDDAAVRAVALAFLGTLDAKVTACASGEEAMVVLDSGSDFDLLLTDIALGAGMRGTELATQAQASRPALAVLLVSGFSAELIDADRVAPLDWELLPKPYSRNDLARAVATAVSQASRAKPA
jgi:PAS domain S-box-containing protein